jgi:hypothetical protein
MVWVDTLVWANGRPGKNRDCGNILTHTPNKYLSGSSPAIERAALFYRWHAFAEPPISDQLYANISRATFRIEPGSKPNLPSSAFSGAEPPKVCMPITRPFGPT